MIQSPAELAVKVAEVQRITTGNVVITSLPGIIVAFTVGLATIRWVEGMFRFGNSGLCVLAMGSDYGVLIAVW